MMGMWERQSERTVSLPWSIALNLSCVAFSLVVALRWCCCVRFALFFRFPLLGGTDEIESIELIESNQSSIIATMMRAMIERADSTQDATHNTQHTTRNTQHAKAATIHQLTLLLRSAPLLLF